MRIRALIRRLIRDESGVTLIEYGLLAALLALACVTVLGSLGTKLNNSFNNVNNAVP
ncbi:MAG TPA: Flp family type IVb pilin [Tepidisphaeraceae bacterium]|nr:Flp family type IVb pilin [Tepidisphaeraceae bacterium]